MALDCARVSSKVCVGCDECECRGTACRAMCGGVLRVWRPRGVNQGVGQLPASWLRPLVSLPTCTRVARTGTHPPPCTTRPPHSQPYLRHSWSAARPRGGRQWGTDGWARKDPAEGAGWERGGRSEAAGTLHLAPPQPGTSVKARGAARVFPAAGAASSVSGYVHRGVLTIARCRQLMCVCTTGTTPRR